MPLGIHVAAEEKEGIVVLRLKGRIDATSTPGLEKKIQPFLENNMRLLIDFSEVDYLSSAGMRLLLSARKKFTAKNGLLGFCGINEGVMEIIKVAGFDKILTIYPTEREALAALAVD